jgi:hypothetical protein
MASSATIIENNQSAKIDGWNITVPTGVSLAVTSSDSEIFIEKTANFKLPNQGFQVVFQPVSGASGAATKIDFTDESVQNNTAAAWNQFQFLLLNVGSVNATFPGTSNAFLPPSGTGYNYTSVALNSSKDALTYTGSQSTGTTSLWGGTTANDNLLIDAPAGSDFSLKELPGTGGPPPVVPLPAAIWQSVATLTVLGGFGLCRSKRAVA